MICFFYGLPLVGLVRLGKLRAKKWRAVLLISACSFWWTTPFVYAQQTSSTIAQGFAADTSQGAIVAGSLVSIKSKPAATVELATTETTDNLAGVVAQNPLVSISGSSQEVQVVLSGSTNVLVSDINGPIHAGDKITTSPIAGVGMRATADSQIVGIAQADFNTAASETQSITDRKGVQRTVHIGQVPLQVGIAFYQAPGSNFLPPFLQSIANSLAGRPVSLIRVLLCTVLLLIGFISVAVLIYSSVRSAMTSLGRNPLAARAIRKGLYQAIAVAVVVIGVTILTSYFILSV